MSAQIPLIGARHNYGTASTKLLYVNLRGAANLNKRDILGLSDPYARITIIQKLNDGTLLKNLRHRTKTIHNSLNPVWNEQRLFNVAPEQCSLLIELFDENRLSKDDFLGQVTIDLGSSTLPSTSSPSTIGPVSYTLTFRPNRPSRVKGNILMSLAYYTPSGGSNGAGDPENITTVNADDNNDEQLPTGWEQRTDANGRTFYVDHNNKVTQWERPTQASSRRPVPPSAAAPPSAGSRFQTTRRQVSLGDSAATRPTRVGEDWVDLGGDHSAEEEPLPPGWQRTQAPNGRYFFIDHTTKTTSWNDPRTGRPSARPGAGPSRQSSKTDSGTVAGGALANSQDDIDARLGPLPNGWEKRMHGDRAFFVDHINRRTQWDDPRLQQFSGPGVEFSETFKVKKDAFRAKLRAPTGWSDKFEIRVRRERILDDTMTTVMAQKSVDNLKKKLWIVFENEPGLDFSGVQREYFLTLSKELFNPYYGLFMYSAIDNYTLQVNPNSGEATVDHLQFFHFIGRCMGMAIFHGHLLDGFFIRPFYKMLLGKPVSLADYEAVDSDLFNSWTYILENDVEEIGELMFVDTDTDLYGNSRETELCPGGANKLVTDENKKEYVNLLVKHRFQDRIGKQMEQLVKGLEEFIPHERLAVFDENELELLIGGIQTIDADDWKKYTAYKNGYNADHPTIVLFWRFVYTQPNQLRTRLLQYTTGTSQLPGNGFRELHGSNGPQHFTIQLWDTDLSHLPQAHTCFNRLELPPYKTYEDLSSKLLKALEFNQGFGTD